MCQADASLNVVPAHGDPLLFWFRDRCVLHPHPHLFAIVDAMAVDAETLWPTCGPGGRGRQAWFERQHMLPQSLKNGRRVIAGGGAAGNE